MECLNCGCFQCCCRTKLPGCCCPDRAYPSLKGGHRDFRKCPGIFEEFNSLRSLYSTFKCSYCGAVYLTKPSEVKCFNSICNRCGGSW